MRTGGSGHRCAAGISTITENVGLTSRLLRFSSFHKSSIPNSNLITNYQLKFQPITQLPVNFTDLSSKNFDQVSAINQPFLTFKHELLAIMNQIIPVREVFNRVLKLSHWPITKDTRNPVNQSKLKVKTCSRREARENVRERVTIGFGFTSDWLRKWREFLKPVTKHINA